jgi:hypothetical protein
MRTMIRLLTVAAALVAIAATTAAPAAASHPVHPAVTCSKDGCDKQDPQQSGCSTGATTVGSANIQNGPNNRVQGLVELRWSSTCQTNWSRVTVYDNQNLPDFWASVQRQSDGLIEQTHFTFQPTNGGQYWSPMVYAPGCAHAYGQLDYTYGLIGALAHQASPPSCTGY